MTSQRPQVVIVMSRCRKSNENFGIRLEQKTKDKWMADWTFAIKEDTAKREGYDQTKISGTFEIDVSYPGCPYCKSHSFFKCSCGKVACWDDIERVTCPWCYQTIHLTTRIESLDAGSDR